MMRSSGMLANSAMQYEYHNPSDNIAIAIYRDEKAAQQAIDASPIRFALEKAVTEEENAEDESINDLEDDEEEIPSRQGKSGIDELLRASTLSEPKLTDADPTPVTSASLPFAPPEPKKTKSKWFQVTVDRSRTIHRDYVERQPFWKQFSPTKSTAQVDLQKKVPHIGLSDVSKRPPDAHRTPNWVLKQMNSYLEKGMPDLMRMYEENRRDIKDQDRR